MAAQFSKEEVSDDSLNAMFKKGLGLHDELDSTSDPTNSPQFQHRARKAILLLEDATRLVSLLDLFSTNEDYSELPTESIKFLILPVLLGSLNSRLVDQDRMETIKIVETYYNDFLQRLKSYGVIKDLPKAPKHGAAEAVREQKMMRYKETKALEASLKELKLAIENPSSDDDVVREYYRTLVKRFSWFAIEELESLQTEKELLEGMAKMRGAEGPPQMTQQRPPCRPLKPIIITKDAMQKEVFGLGYKNIPVMSIEEFYEQRVRDGWFPKPTTNKNPAGSLMDRALDAEAAARAEEDEMRILETKEENDDPEELARKRNFDEYKDDHKRGEGNRHNKG